MKFRPLHDRVVIERIEAEARTAKGIIRVCRPPRLGCRRLHQTVGLIDATVHPYVMLPIGQPASRRNLRRSLEPT